MADARVHVRFELRLQIYPWQWAVLEQMYDPATINRLRTMCGPKQLERHAYPGQASQRAVRVPARCTCHYGVPLRLAFTVFATPRFTIRRSCPQHGARECPSCGAGGYHWGCPDCGYTGG